MIEQVRSINRSSDIPFKWRFVLMVSMLILLGLVYLLNARNFDTLETVYFVEQARVLIPYGFMALGAFIWVIMMIALMLNKLGYFFMMGLAFVLSCFLAIFSSNLLLF